MRIRVVGSVSKNQSGRNEPVVSQEAIRIDLETHCSVDTLFSHVLQVAFLESDNFKRPIKDFLLVAP